jgi:hypothetical protein
METKEYTWLEVNDMQALLREIEQGLETYKEGLLIKILEKQYALGLRCDLL